MYSFDNIHSGMNVNYPCTCVAVFEVSRFLFTINSIHIHIQVMEISHREQFDDFIENQFHAFVSWLLIR